MIHEVEDSLEVCVAYSFQVQQGVLVGVSSQHISKEWAAGTQNNFVCLYLFIITGKSENILLSQGGINSIDERKKI